MSIYASSSDLVLLAVLLSLRGTGRMFTLGDLCQFYVEWQIVTGSFVYGFAPSDREGVLGGLSRDLADLEDRCLVEKSDDGTFSVSHLGLPIAASLALSPPLDRLARFCRGGGLSVCDEESVIDKVLRIIREQPYAPGTHTGERQQWVKEEISRKVKALRDGDGATRGSTEGGAK